MQIREHVAPLVRHEHLHRRNQGAQSVTDPQQQVLDTLPGDGGDRDGTGIGVGETSRLVGPVGLVEHEQLGHGLATDVSDDLSHCLHLPLGVRTRPVDHVNQQIPVVDDVERGRERLHQLVRQLLDESDGVGQQHRLTARELQPTCRRIERREEAILDEDTSLGQTVEQGRLARVGVPDDDHVAQRRPATCLPLGVAVAGDLDQIGLELVDQAGDTSTVEFELRLTRTAASAHATGLLGHRPALAAQARQAVLEQRQLDLCLALLAVGVLGEDVEDQRSAVDRGTAEQLLQVVLLGRAEFVVEDHRVTVGRERELADLLDLALADVRCRVRMVTSLHDASDDIGASGVDQ